MIESKLNSLGVKYIPSGKNVKICCPFHIENHPSMSVQKTDGYFQCFGCYEKGDWFKLLAKLENKTIAEVKFFEEKFDANKFIPVKKEPRKYVDEIKFKKIFEPVGQAEINYLLKRKLTIDSIRKFDLRVIKKEALNYKLYKWKNRIIFPMYCEGKFKNFSGRHLTDNGPYKKLNYVLPKTDLLYGLDYLKNTKYLVLVEGEIDAIYLQQFGLNAVAIIGSFLSDWQLTKIIKTTDRVFLMFDGDDVGKKLNKNVQNILTKYLLCDIVWLSDGKDPNDLSVMEVEKIKKDVECFIL